MSHETAYFRPKGLQEALNFLWRHGPEATLLAGGTDVMVDMRSSEMSPRYLVDISRIEAIQGIRRKGNAIWIGAATTIAEIYRSDLLRREAPALWKSARFFASEQIRNVATIGGNVAHCAPCGDTLPPLLVYGGRAGVATAEGSRLLPVERIQAGPYRSALEPQELITHFELQPEPDALWSFQKITRRRELAIARISMAVAARKDREDRFTMMRIALGSSTPTPRRLREAEAFLLGKRPTERLIWEAGAAAAQAMIAASGRRPSTVYKEKAVQGLLVRILRSMDTS